MAIVKIITFKGCQPTVDLRDKLEALAHSENLDVDIELKLVASPDLAEEMGLYGSPTILVDGVEFQQELRGPTGFF